MKKKSKKSVFVLQIAENCIKAARFSVSGAKRELVKTETENIPAGTDDKWIGDSAGRILKRLGFNANQLIVSLPRNLVTCRFLKVPTQSAEEIEKIASLQASRFLPYPPDELVTGYEILSEDKEGFSGVNLIIAHKPLIQRYINIFSALKPEKFSIFLSSLGISRLYTSLKNREIAAAMAIDIDAANVEAVVIEEEVLTFSRTFRINTTSAGWKKALLDEINKTRDAYSKEFSRKPPERLFVFAREGISKEAAEALAQPSGIAVEELTRGNLFDGAGNSFAPLIGLGLAHLPESLNLLPKETKEKLTASVKFKERLRLALFTCAILILWIMAFAKGMDNKARYLARLKDELKKIAKEAKPLEDMEKRFKAIKSSSSKKTSLLEILRELYNILPQQIYLSGIIYEETGDLTLRGQAQELNSVLNFVSQLERSDVFKRFGAKIRYATKKAVPGGEVVDFEITCPRKRF